MFADFFRRLTDSAPSDTPEHDAQTALAVLLVRLARSNGDYEPSEVSSIETILSRRYGLDKSSVKVLRIEAEAIEATANDTVQFTRAIKEAVSLEDRDSVLEALWELALADGDHDWEEEGMLRLVAPLLGVNDRDSALARQRVQARLAEG